MTGIEVTKEKRPRTHFPLPETSGRRFHGCIGQHFPPLVPYTVHEVRYIVLIVLCGTHRGAAAAARVHPRDARREGDF